MKSEKVLIGLMALTIVLSGCNKGASTDTNANNNQNVPSSYQPYNNDQNVPSSYQPYNNDQNVPANNNDQNVPANNNDQNVPTNNNDQNIPTNNNDQNVPTNYQPYNNNNSSSEYENYDDSEDEWGNTECDRISRILETFGYILDGNFDTTLSCDNASMDEYSGKVLTDLDNLKLAYENDDTEAIKKFGSNLVENTNELQKLARDYIIWDTFLKQTVPEENQMFLGDDPFFRDISEVKDALICLDQLSLRIDNEEVHSYDYAYEDALLHNGSNTVIFYDWFMVEKGGIEKFSDSISSLYNEGLDATLDKWDIETLNHDMNNFYREYYETYGIPISFGTGDTGNKVYKKV